MDNELKQLLFKKLGSIGQTSDYALQNIKGSIEILNTRRISKKAIDEIIEMLTVSINKVEVVKSTIDQIKRDLY